MVPFRPPTMVPFRLPTMVPFLLPTMVPLRLPGIVPAKVAVVAEMVMSAVTANVLSDFISILLVNDSFAGAVDGELLAQLHLHPVINNGFVVLNYKKYAKTRLSRTFPQSLFAEALTANGLRC
jgi:hypothetical protein